MSRAPDPSLLQDPAHMVVNSTLEFYRKLTKFPGAQYRDTGKLITLSTHVQHPICNAILQTDLDPDTLDAEIQERIGFFKEKGLPFSWYVWPSSKPRNLGERLLANGLTHASSSPGMVADLSHLPDEVPYLGDLEIKRAVTEKMMADWLIPIDQAFQLPDFVNDFFIRVYLALGLDENNPTRHFVAYLEGRPIACSTLYLGADQVAGIWNVATTSEARGKGIGTAVTWRACQAAVEQGYTHAILRSSEMGYHVYKRLGFKEAFRDQVYVWQPPEQHS